MIDSLYAFFLESGAWGIAISILAGLTTAATFFKKVLLPFSRRMTRVVGDLRNVSETLPDFADALPTILDIHQEFRPNGGSSLRDVVNRIEGQLFALDSRMAIAQFTNRMHLDSLDCVAFIDCDASGLLTWASDGWAQLTGRGAGTAIGNGWSEAIHPDDRTAVWNEWAMCRDNIRPFNMDFRFLRPDGTAVRVHARAVPSVDSSGTVTSWSGSIIRRGRSLCDLGDLNA